MADVFFTSDAQKLLKKKHIVIFGDSNARAIYKDLLWLLNHNKLIDQTCLKRKQENSFCGDKLGKHSELNRGREYEEERSYEKGDVRVNFYFITKCYNPLLVDMMEDIHLGLRDPPDVIYINSTLWDVSRWGPSGVSEFKDNLQKLARLFKSSLPTSTLVIWATALPVSSKVQSSLLIKQIDFLQHTLRFDVMEANHFARQVMVAHGFDVLDNHFHMRMQVHRRVHDGVHYFPVAIRLLTNLFLTHLALSWDFPLPRRVNTILLEKTKALCASNTDSSTPLLKSPDILADKKKSKVEKTKDKKVTQEKSEKRVENKKPNKKQNFKYKPKKNWKNNPGRFRLREQQTFHQPRVKRVNDNWRPSSCNQNIWSGQSVQASNQRTYIDPWINNPTSTPIWSDDHWPTGEQFHTEPSSYPSNSILGRSSQLLARSRQEHISQNRRRYAPY